MTVSSERIVRRKLADEVIDRLKAMIASGEMRPGDALPSERELIERFGVGRLPIREALQTLSNMGLIVISHGERARVREVTAQSVLKQIEAAATIMLSSSPNSLEQLKAARRFFERGMVREAAMRAGPDDIAALRATLDRQMKLIGKPEQFLSVDMRFHNEIAAISGNPIFAAVSEAMLSWLKQYHTDLLFWSGNEHITLAEHESILKHIAAHDPDGAEAAMVAHLDRSADLYAHQRAETTHAE
ncbi:MAG: transcriptional regulator NanR [Alsobacter sp.]